MKSEKWVTAMLAAALACLLSLGSVGCVVTAFELPLESAQTVALACLGSAFFCAVVFRWKQGGLAVLLVSALLAGYLWRRDQAWEQVLQLISRVSHVYDQAYGWGTLSLTEAPWDAGYADLPMGILGAVIALACAWTVSRGEHPLFAIAPALLPLFSCLVVTDTVPGAPFLFLLIYALILLLLTGRVRSGNPSQGNRLTLFSAIPTALALGVLFLAVPREGYVNRSAELRDSLLTRIEEWSGTVSDTVQGAASGARSSEPETVNLAALGRRIESTAPVMEVTAEVGGTLYLRGQDYDAYDGTGWTATRNRVEDFSCQGIDLGSVTIRTRNKLDQLYLPYYPASAQRLVSGKLDNTRLATEYTVSRVGLPDDWRQQAGSDSPELPFVIVDSPGSAQDSLRYRTLPLDTQSRAEVLLESLSLGQTAVEKAEAIAAFVRGSARYDKNTSRMPESEPDFALWFLEESETGYCVHFATAAVVLLRAAGVEARYVSGYMVRAQAGQTVTVTGENAHAWAEYYEPALDTWLILESTPADTNALEEPPRSETEPAAAPTEAETQATEAPPRPSAGTEPGSTPTPETSPAPAAAVKKQAPGWLGTLVKIILLLAATAVGLEGQRILRIRLRRQRQRSGTANSQALARWQEAELLAKLLKTTPPKELEVLALKAKFSQHALMAEELTVFEAYLRAARKQLRQMPWYHRLLHEYVFAIY
ncbi:MAG: transglutaminaseTgpA domain-containing protein [Faecousia sp.]